MLTVLAGVGGVVVGRVVAHLRRTGQTARLVLVTAALVVGLAAWAVAAWASPGRLPFIAFVLAYAITYALSPLRPRDRATSP
ncbi:hypothetical protein KIN34_05185 [Cellulomonas sp. DKR-3]|uniref:Major facilitator superfamily (MFS) profile domain-containing protein n=1 Tax=Cellulomonas fulva TaxID=2835530 RepID=A0ABS5TWY8_9CELL|nr:hypothetical protein [Cellulomonas fulva]MBT0993678.1 hypothetical protein [Cellulomonas fulva]